MKNWRFIDEQGTFRLDDPHHSSYLYFPLLNEVGMMSAITPTLNGDIKTGLNTFLNLPVSVEDLHNTRSGRNFWVTFSDEDSGKDGVDGATGVDGVTGANSTHSPWSVSGVSAAQIAQRFTGEEEDDVTLEAGLLWHTLRRRHPSGLQASITNFVPVNEDQVELMKVTLTNEGDAPLTVTPTAAIPLFGRSADNLRDHRHVTSLLNRVVCTQNGILLNPTLTFDERGHAVNHVIYGVLGVAENGGAPVGFYPVIEEFIGEGGSLDWPQAMVKPGSVSTYAAGDEVDGYEALGGLVFEPVTLAPGESRSYVLILAIMPQEDRSAELLARYGTAAHFDEWLQKTEDHWQSTLESVAAHTGDTRFDGWMRWVSLQPILRRLMGNSFLPYHDYGRGGRGWRDLWQDILALLMMESVDVGPMLADNFAGVRIDGSNATIIGAKRGEFKADRNNIPRTWMDHGAWPLLTTQLYIDLSGNLGFLLQEQSYFKDKLTHRAKGRDEAWSTEKGTFQRTADGDPYTGSILEHMLLQHLTPFFNVGEHNTIKLEDADWNDGMDMAHRRGESVAFSAFYASNLQQLAGMVRALSALSKSEVKLAEEIQLLLDRLPGQEAVDYGSVSAKHARLNRYFDSCAHTVSGDKVGIGLEALAQDLEAKADWLANQIREQEWIQQDGIGWFNGYYDDDGEAVEGPLADGGGVRMTLTGQVFALMGNVATDAQAAQMVKAVDRYLYDPKVGGVRLNTDFDEVRLNLGRCFGFAFGHKENGAMFSHMAVMYANALYKRGFVQEGYRVLNGIYEHSQNFEISRMYPGIPEYMSERGRGMYPYLTGSASWYLLTLITEAFGVRGNLGDLLLDPKLVVAQFDEAGQASINTKFAGRSLRVTYANPQKLAHGSYQIHSVSLNGSPVETTLAPGGVRVARSLIEGLSSDGTHTLLVELA